MTKKRCIALVLMVGIIAMMVAGCGTAPSQSAAASPSASQSAAPTPTEKEPVEIRWMTTETAGSTTYEMFNQYVDDYLAANKHVDLTVDALPSADLRTKINTEMSAGSPPDCSWMVASYTREFVKADLIYDWGKIRNDPKHPEFNQWFKEADWEYVKFNDVYMYAPREAAVDGLYYNTELFQANGWEPPKTFTDLLDLCKKADEKGLNALAVAGKDIRFAWLASCLMLRTGGADNLKALAIGDQKTNKWDDPKFGFVDAMTKFKEMVDAKAYPDGCLGANVQDAANQFAQGQTLMYYEGAFRVNDFMVAGGQEFVDKVKIVPFPSIENMPNATPDYIVGGPTSGMIIANGLGEYKTEEVINLVKGYLSPDYQVPAMEVGGSLYAGQAKYDTTKFRPVLNDLMDRFQVAVGAVASMDSMAPPEVDNAIKKTAMPGLVAGTYKTVAEAVAEVQKAADDYAKK